MIRAIDALCSAWGLARPVEFAGNSDTAQDLQQRIGEDVREYGSGVMPSRFATVDKLWHTPEARQIETAFVGGVPHDIYAALVVHYTTPVQFTAAQRVEVLGSLVTSWSPTRRSYFVLLDNAHHWLHGRLRLPADIA